jgi:hypothetical protein
MEAAIAGSFAEKISAVLFLSFAPWKVLSTPCGTGKVGQKIFSFL